MPFYPQGHGETLGDALLTSTAPIYNSGQTWFVCSVNGDDAALGDGLEKKRPLATLAQAQTNASAGDMVVLLDGHTETLGAALSISKKLVIVGSGRSSGKPTVKFYASADVNIFTIDAVDVQVRNVFFGEPTAACNAAPIKVNSQGFVAKDLYFECGDNQVADSAPDCSGIYVGPGAGLECTVTNCSFVVTSTAAATPPAPGLYILNGVVRASGCLFDGGSYGWYGTDGAYAVVVTECIEAEEMTMTSGSDVAFDSSATGYFQSASGTQSPRIDLGVTVGG